MWKTSCSLTGRSALAAITLCAAFAPLGWSSRPLALDQSALCSALVEQGRGLLAQTHFAEAEELLARAATQCPETPAIFDSLGIARDFNGHSAQAQAAFRRAIALDPKASGFHNHLAASLIRTGYQNAGIAEFRKTLAIEPANETANLNLANLSLAKRQYAGALRFLKAAQAERSRDPIVLLQLSHAYFGTGDAKAGRETAQRLARFPDLEPSLHFSLGLLLAEYGDYEPAARQFAAIPSADRDSPTDLNLGIAYSKLGRFEEARAAYEDALRLDPSNPDVYLRIGLNVGQSGDENAALDWIVQASRKAPDRADIECALAQQLIRGGNFEQARDTLTHALASHPNDPGLRETQGDLLLREGNPDEAVKVYRDLLAADSLRVTARISLAKAYEELRQNDAARHELEITIRSDPESAEAKAQLGRLELEAGHQSAAEEWIKQALAADPNDLTANEQQAVLLLRAGKLADAESLLQRLARLDPRNPQIHYQLGRVLAQLQKNGEAQAEFGLSRQLQATHEQHTP